MLKHVLKNKNAATRARKFAFASVINLFINISDARTEQTSSSVSGWQQNDDVNSRVIFQHSEHKLLSS